MHKPIFERFTPLSAQLCVPYLRIHNKYFSEGVKVTPMWKQKP